MSGDVILSVRNVTVDYEGTEPVHAVRSVSFDVRRGEVLGIAGERGCGKSTLVYAIARLLQPPARMTAGEVTFHPPDADPVNVLALRGDELRLFRCKRIALVLQNAMNALNPVMPIRTQLGEVFTSYQPNLTRRERDDYSRRVLELMGIGADLLSSYPDELSGVLRQRLTIAMAIALRPDVVIMDEPAADLDAVAQREILAELDRLRVALGFAVMLITRDLPLLLEISDRVMTMYAGRTVEHGTAADILAARPTGGVGEAT